VTGIGIFIGACKATGPCEIRGGDATGPCEAIGPCEATGPCEAIGPCEARGAEATGPCEARGAEATGPCEDILVLSGFDLFVIAVALALPTNIIVLSLEILLVFILTLTKASAVLYIFDVCALSSFMRSAVNSFNLFFTNVGRSALFPEEPKNPRDPPNFMEVVQLANTAPNGLNSD